MSNADFREGLKSGFPIALSAAPFGALFGAVAVDNGLSVAEATIMSGTVYAGASQLVGIELFGQKVDEDFRLQQADLGFGLPGQILPNTRGQHCPVLLLQH